MMRKGGTSSAPTTPRGGLHARGAAQPTQLAEEHHIVATTFVQADVTTFREVVQKLTGPPSPLPRTPTGSAAASEGGSAIVEGKEPSPSSLRRDAVPAGRPELERLPSVKPVGGPGPQRSNTTKLLERRQNAKKLEVKQLMGPHILKRTISPALSPVSPLTTVDVFAEQSGATSPLGYMGYSSASTPPTAPASPFELSAGASRLELAAGATKFELATRASAYDVEQASPSSFDLNGGICRLDLQQCTPSPREPRLLPLFPLHSPRSLSS